MNTEQIIAKLNWFYSLEINQVDLYTMQSKQVDDIYIKKILSRVAEIEQEHVDSIREKVLAMDGKPTVLGEAIAPLMGTTAGFVTGKVGLIFLLKANIKLEEKAMKDYKDFLLRVGHDEDLSDLLWNHLIDEDLHTAWFANKVNELEQIAIH